MGSKCQAIFVNGLPRGNSVSFRNINGFYHLCMVIVVFTMTQKNGPHLKGYESAGENRKDTNADVLGSCHVAMIENTFVSQGR
jgi:hypothetical protein